MNFRSSSALSLCVAAAVTLASGSAIPGPLAAVSLETEPQSDVIVIMRDQLANAPPVRRAMASRADALAISQMSVLSQLQKTHPRTVKSFSTINAFATKVTAAEFANLVNRPDVQSVVPDRVIRALPRREKLSATVQAASASSAGGSGNLCNTLEPEALQLTNTAFLDASAPQAQTVLDGNGKPITGKGVKVAYIADGLDPNVPGFIRPDGSHVFVDYQDFSGDPAGTATDGGEAFGDASSIAAQDMPKGTQLNYDISTYVAPAHALPSPCNIHIRGMAPGASLVGLKVFAAGATTTSSFVQAIEYAVVHDDVDVINESFGDNPYPDEENDPISLADDAAVKAGVTVTVSSGDGGSNGTLGSPATDSNVISVAASTQFRLFAQTGLGVIPLLPAKGYVDNNVSAFSSGGFAAVTPRTVDVIAPGMDGWALCSSNIALYSDCLDDNDNPSAIEDFGGTSESAPLTAGEAALVIQAYRSTHGGKDPSPALVKQIIMSSATDLGAPTSEQGAGLINSLAAVRLALSINDSNGKPKASGAALLSDTGSIALTAAGNTHETEKFKITNVSTTARMVAPVLQTLSAPVATATINVQLSPSSDPTFPNASGSPRAYVKRTFTIPSGLDHLDAAIAYQVSLTSTATPIVYLSLVDPAGRQLQYSEPQGFSVGYGHVDVVKPVGGTYTAYIYTRASGVGSYAGPVQMTWSAERFVNLGSVSPAEVNLGPGASQTFTASFFTPSDPGDIAAGIRFTPTGGALTPTIPVTIRTLVPIGPTGGSFSGVLTGGNGRSATGNLQTYEFDVPAGVQDMSVAVPVADNGYLLAGFLIDPQGMQLSIDANVDPFGAAQYGLQHFRYSPQPGRWRFLLVQTFTSSGNQTSLPFTARIGFNQAKVVAPDLPNSAAVKLSASGKPVTVEIDFINTGLLTAAYFVDARLNYSKLLQLSAQPDCAAVTTLPGTCAEFIVPTQTSTVKFTAKSSVPIQMDAQNLVGYAVGTGNPDIFAVKTGTDAVAASLTEPELSYGTWYVNPSEIGPFSSAGAPNAKVKMTGSVVAKPFDAAVSADSGDAWADLTLGTKTFNPVIVVSGEEGTINVTITPDPAKIGTTIRGTLYIDTYNPNLGTGDEVVALPYSYTVVK